MESTSEGARKEIILRLRRIEGQVRGLQKMVDEERDCDEIVIQLSAIRAALEKVSLSIVGSYMVECITKEVKESGECVRAIEKAKEMFMKLS
ncbi:MAG: metal-sensitive transcriptional regulator [bacterium]|jgi:DNA-binding FrmR family transcriptional regulator